MVISTVLLENIILTRLKFGGELADVMTRFDGSSYKTYPKNDKFCGHFRLVLSRNALEAVICHIGLVKMLADCKQIDCSVSKFNDKKPTALATDINLSGIHFQEYMLESKFT